MTVVQQLPQDEALWSHLAATYEVQIRYGIFMKGWNRGFDLSPATLASIVRLRAIAIVDIYSEGDDADEGAA